jgi:thiol:disulfide interchange protein
MLLNFTPCVLPIIPLTVGFFVYQSQRGADKRTADGRGSGQGSQGSQGSRGSLLAAGLLFGLGMVLTYAALGGAVVLASRRFGELFELPAVLLGLGLFIIVMALGMFGV